MESGRPELKFLATVSQSKIKLLWFVKQIHTAWMPFLSGGTRVC